MVINIIYLRSKTNNQKMGVKKVIHKTFYQGVEDSFNFQGWRITVTH